jgi:uncharacterized protein with HEPN domain
LPISLRILDRIERFTTGLNADSLARNEQAFYAVLHALLIISEAARRSGNEAETLAPDQPWQSIRSLGNVCAMLMTALTRALFGRSSKTTSPV